MGLLDGLKGELKVRLSDEPEWKEKRFENYVARLFDPRSYAVVGRNGDSSAANAPHPDLVFRCRRTGELFAVECEYRSELDPEGILEWPDPEQLERCRAFAHERYVPVFVVVGLGGFSDEPECMFVIPLKDAEYPALSPGAFTRYSRNPKEPFFWERGRLS
ncbi:hypothetical protein FGU65_09460 [Methanoculleus sp. FWC-SCC1]|uniref:Restriction endonuclease n=1 Tax=Methanoculleus frigidifontis TaxID=2584085 RepID=A0ABT8MB15_9EURY|nr:hypothetical protein [Methanoculleus sp. FWC-SCC1]MDN7025112.1 hypothetical protein [Methanoculleus sp. FWC-SCC1]